MHIKLSAGKRKKKVETQVGWHCGQRTIGQGSRALTHTDSPLGGQAADGAENPSWQQSCISTFFFFLPTQLCLFRFQISAATHLGATCQDCKSLSVLALGSNPQSAGGGTRSENQEERLPATRSPNSRSIHSKAPHLPQTPDRATN